MYVGTIFCCHHICLWHSVSEVEAIAEAIGFVFILSFYWLPLFCISALLYYQRLQHISTKVMANLDWDTVKYTGINVTTRILSFSEDTTPAADHASIWNSLGDRIQCHYLLWVYKERTSETQTTLQTSPTLSNLTSSMVSLQPYCIKKISQILSRISILWKSSINF